jgi:hypothetical protein
MVLANGVSINSTRALMQIEEKQNQHSVFSVTSLKKEAASEIDFIIIASQMAFDRIG